MDGVPHVSYPNVSRLQSDGEQTKSQVPPGLSCSWNKKSKRQEGVRLLFLVLSISTPITHPPHDFVGAILAAHGAQGQRGGLQAHLHKASKRHTAPQFSTATPIVL